MNRNTWIATAYGYIVCIVAVITLLVNVSGIIDASFDRARPLQGRGGAFGPSGASLTSFEAFQATYNERERAAVRPAGAPTTGADTLSTAELRRRYEALRADRIAQMSYSASQRIVKHTLLILLAIVLFATHWRWVQRQRDAAGSAGAAG